ncbi:hypothetical protein CHX26_09090 [Porphyrobacter sp. HT-58-2]|nr:hypothetical protein CHX26_09090 [Porphyrobacter sp. HT-58-2]
MEAVISPLPNDVEALKALLVSALQKAEEAEAKLAVWRYDYNNVRPHSSLGNRTPAQARRAFLQDGSVPPGALVPAGVHEYQTGRLSL